MARPAKPKNLDADTKYWMHLANAHDPLIPDVESFLYSVLCLERGAHSRSPISSGVHRLSKKV